MTYNIDLDLVEECIVTFRAAGEDYARSVRYLRSECEDLRAKSAYFSTLRRVLEKLLVVLGELNTQVDAACSRSAEEKIIWLPEIENLYRKIPPIMAHIGNSYTQRRAKNLHYISFWPSHSKNLSLVEAHPFSFATVRSVEAVNNSFHEKVLPLLQPFDPPPLLISLSNGYEYALQTLSFRGSMFYAAEELSLTLGREFFLCYVMAPRWLTEHIRYTALLAHENSHRAVHLLCCIIEDIFRWEAEGGNIEGLIQHLRNVYKGDMSPLLAIAFRCKNLFQSLCDFAESIVGGAPHPRSVCSHFRELLTDIVSVLIVGQAISSHLRATCPMPSPTKTLFYS